MDWWATPLITSVTAGLITGGLAVFGVWLTQWKTARREHQAWTREQRLNAHTAFLTEQRRLDALWMRLRRIGGKDEDPGEAWYQSLSAKLVDVELFGSLDPALAARRLYTATLKLEDGTVGPMMEVDQASATYLKWVQKDLDLTETGVPLWGLEKDPPFNQRGL